MRAAAFEIQQEDSFSAFLCPSETSGKEGEGASFLQASD
jgi:hypothetical protein